ncbi:MAG: imidazole glycerol phosphate synthase subunit HisH [Methanobrevibacter sp.]|uniref:imidazole glycerol phosphate synthase subunit HisH n=1 Tax=Methanobrevibacter sp. TaxID=66852 RepID=UPI0026DF0A90|nr:imidazole glycerol phosphate synthase subunit HisH [Methanobrevibacter sp.]MDO5847984.1 imidazole glycerol phosphate synthase subunit HisH [Methanobrevibacter sp.]
MITIIDYKSGNLRSISNGFRKLNCDVEVTNDVEKIANAEHLVLPGVGAFGEAMKNIQPFKEVIYEHVEDDKPFLGICLGQQLFMSDSEESLGVDGLNFFKGSVKYLPVDLKIPHMGWNKIKIVNDSPIFEGVDGKYFYFVHSYHAVPEDENVIAATTDYGMDVVAALSENNLFSTQFHPEKSGRDGLKILKNFINLRR